jgi:hypothetical protein
MDNIQIWLYIAFGIIYFIVKQMKKKNADADSQQNTDEEAYQPPRKALTFDDLLKEFTQGQDTLDERPELKPMPVSVAQKPTEVRKFADDESLRVYQQSITQAEGFDLKYERDEHFDLKPMKVLRKDENEEKTIGNEIFDSLSDTNQARKAVILGEILNRKYC